MEPPNTNIPGEENFFADLLSRWAAQPTDDPVDPGDSRTDRDNPVDEIMRNVNRLIESISTLMTIIRSPKSTDNRGSPPFISTTNQIRAVISHPPSFQKQTLLNQHGTNRFNIQGQGSKVKDFQPSTTQIKIPERFPKGIHQELSSRR